MNKILIIEDEQSILDVLDNKLTKDGYLVTLAKNGEEGLETALRDHSDLILLDIKMPRMDGMTMLHKLRDDVWGKNAKVIILTNLDANDDRLNAIVTDQPSYYLIKADTSLETLLVKIKEVLG